MQQQFNDMTTKGKTTTIGTAEFREVLDNKVDFQVVLSIKGKAGRPKKVLFSFFSFSLSYLIGLISGSHWEAWGP